MKEICYLQGDATAPTVEGPKLLVHICNDLGGWGKGFVVALSRRWKAPEKQYRDWFKSQDRFGLGRVQFVRVAADFTVANMVAQHGYKTAQAGIPLRYDALESCLKTVAEASVAQAASVHMPRIGCGLAGGSWEQVEQLIKHTLCQSGIDVYVYDLEG